jgi:hypothetical protein
MMSQELEEELGFSNFETPKIDLLSFLKNKFGKKPICTKTNAINHKNTRVTFSSLSAAHS